MASVPSYEKTTSLVSRALKLNPEALVAAFEPATERDLDAVLALRKRVIGADLVWNDPQYLRWRYHFGAPTRGRGECWVVRRGDELLAMVGSERIELLSHANKVPGLSLMDIAVQPELNGVGLGVWMVMHLFEKSGCLLAVGSNTNSRAIVSRVFDRLPDRRSYAHLIDFKPKLRRSMRRAWVAAVASTLANTASGLWRAGLRITSDRSLRVEPLQRFDDSVNELISQSLSDTDEISLARDAQFLNWRLRDNPRSDYSIWSAKRGRMLVGYVAVQVKTTRDGTRLAAIEDLLFAAGPGAAGIAKALLSKVFEHAASQNCERVTLIACHVQTESVLRRMGFFPVRATAETLSVKCRDAVMVRTIQAGAPWHLTGANTDRDE
jgi:ribosomal protein S18 acetylase RimI-like enzyme